MHMNSLKERIEWLERELPPNPPRFKIYDDLPFAILRYDPAEEWDLRHEVKLLATRLEKHGLRVTTLALSELLWQAIEQTEGLEAIVALEKERGFAAAEEQVNTYLSDPDFLPLPDLLSKRLADLDPTRDICFLTRAASLAPSIYHVSKLLHEMQGRTQAATILFYPGSLEGNSGLRYMGLPDRDSPPAYRVKIYG
jgi:hypothetical protein